MDLDALTRAYRNIRDAKAQINREAEAKVAELDEKLAKIEAVMLKILNDGNGEGIRTASGTFFRKMDVVPSGQDWAAFYAWVKENDAFDALERRIKKTFIVDYMNNHDGEIPPGVNVFRRFKVEVRKNDS